ncbi:hypothetical protein ACTGU9_10340 [Streptococcus suis]
MEFFEGKTLRCRLRDCRRPCAGRRKIYAGMVGKIRVFHRQQYRQMFRAKRGSALPLRYQFIGALT